MKILSFNVNGVRAAFRKGVGDWIQEYMPDILGLQETKSWEEQLSSEITQLRGYHCYISKPQKKGYSGVGLYSREKPLKIVYDFFEDSVYDSEGRVILAEYHDFVLLNVYFPNGVSGIDRLAYKMKFYYNFIEKIKDLLQQNKSIIVMGDVNTAHQAIDLEHPKNNEKQSGFLPEEREWIDQFLKLGFIDTFRYFYPTLEKSYSWWDYKTRARDRNVGWRIDYIFASKSLENRLRAAKILTQILGSDHCPVELELS